MLVYFTTQDRFHPRMKTGGRTPGAATKYSQDHPITGGSLAMDSWGPGVKEIHGDQGWGWDGGGGGVGGRVCISSQILVWVTQHGTKLLSLGWQTHPQEDIGRGRGKEGFAAGPIWISAWGTFCIHKDVWHTVEGFGLRYLTNPNRSDH